MRPKAPLVIWVTKMSCVYLRILTERKAFMSLYGSVFTLGFL